MITTVRVILGTILFALLLPFTLLYSRIRMMNPREYGLNQKDREFETVRKFGIANASRVRSMLASRSARA